MLKYNFVELLIDLLDEQKPKTKTKNQIFLLITFRLCIHFKKEKHFPLLFSCPPYSKCIKRLLNFHLHQQKIFWFLVFSFSFWFQFIQQIEHMLLKQQTSKNHGDNYLPNWQVDSPIKLLFKIYKILTSNAFS